MSVSGLRILWAGVLSGSLCGCLEAATTEPEPAAVDQPESIETPAAPAAVEAPDLADVVESEPAPPAPAPPSPAEIEQLLGQAGEAVTTLGIRRKPVRHLRGPHPAVSGLDEAYAEKRAMGYEGKLEDVQSWMALAKFGQERPSDPDARGPLARYDLCVTRKGSQAWLHVIVPAQGLADERGEHFKAEGRERWVLLSDRARAGVDYVPFKRSAAPSLSRQWGKESVIDDLVDLAAAYHRETGVHLGIGDVSHVTGGKMKDHWTHRVGADADVYLLDYPEGEAGPVVVWNYYRHGRSIWSTQPKGKGRREKPLPADDLTLTGSRLRTLARLVLEKNDVAYFVHNDATILDDFDAQAGERKPGRRYLHAKNKGYWPEHADHVHLRWNDGPLPVGVTPKP